MVIFNAGLFANASGARCESGPQWNLAAVPPGKRDRGSFAAWQAGQMRKFGAWLGRFRGRRPRAVRDAFSDVCEGFEAGLAI